MRTACGARGLHERPGADQDSGGDVAVARQVLGRAVVHGRGAVLEGPEERGRREGAVHQEGEAPPPRDRRQARQVGQPQQRVRDRLDEDRPRRVRERGLHGGRLRGVGEGHADSPARGLLAEQRGGRAVEILSRHEVVARRGGRPAGTRSARPCPRRRRARPRPPRGPPACPPAWCGSGSRTARRRTPPPALPRRRRPARGRRRRRRSRGGCRERAAARRIAAVAPPARSASRSAAARSRMLSTRDRRRRAAVARDHR